MSYLAIFTIISPLIAGIYNGLLCRAVSKKRAGSVAAVLTISSAVAAALVFYDIATTREIIEIKFMSWLEIGSFSSHWSVYVDPLTAIMLIVVTFVSSVVHLYSLGYMSDDEGFAKFLSFLSFFTFFMLILVTADNFLQLFFGWEGVGLCSYLLIGFWYQKNAANKAAIKAFIVNRIADFAFLLGIIIIVIFTGTVDFKSVFAMAEKFAATKYNLLGFETNLIDIICLLLFSGAMGKSAQIGLHIWLPDAMEGPTPVSALIHAATMVTAGVFLVARCSYLFEYSPAVLQFMTIIGATTCLFAATIAITQTDIKKIIAYSTCSQLGYMFLACGISAYHAGIFHLVTHAFFKALLFLSAGSVIHAIGEQDITKMGGLKDKMPITYTNFWTGSLAIMGIFPLAGYYSKDFILESAYASGQLGQFVFWVGIIAAVFTALYSMKIIELVFHGNTRLNSETFSHAHESPRIMNLPLTVLVIGTFCSGMIGYYILRIEDMSGYFRGSIFFANHLPHHNLELAIKLMPLVVGILGIFIGIYLYRSSLATRLASAMSGLHKLATRKYYFDEIYNYTIVKSTNVLSYLLSIFDYKIIDRFGPNGFANSTRLFGQMVSKSQTGYVFNYAFYIIFALVAVITWFIISFIMALN